MFMLTASMMTGISAIDAEHRELVEMINILAAAERQRQSDEVTAALERFRLELEAHFQREEAYLEIVRYPGLAAHMAHHAETLSRLQDIQQDRAARTDLLTDTAMICFDELLRAVLKQDLEVVNWEADSRLLRK
ncbi:MAG: hemerythrin family protein [Alphaproteobacteria bacterium]|nr:hemerythrin family protein [Alphaproteobacteria bacterium]